MSTMTATQSIPTGTKAALVARARVDLQAIIAKYPKCDWQLAEFDKREWTLGVITRDVRTKMGLAFMKGERVILRTETAEDGTLRVLAHSFRNNIDTSLLPRHYRLVSEG